MTTKTTNIDLLPTITKGSAKQIAWAQDIIAEPVIRINQIIVTDETNGICKRDIPVLEQARDEYIHVLNVFANKPGGSMLNASGVIQARNNYLNIAQDIVDFMAQRAGLVTTIRI